MKHCLRFKLLLQLGASFIFSQPFNGLTLISEEDGDSSGTALTQLIDNDENIINEWSHDTDLSGIAYLTSDSILFVSCKINSPNEPNRNGRFKKMNWAGEVIWDFILPDEICRPHHDIEILPNGNILIICSELKTYEELINAGMIIDEAPNININRGNMDMVVEIEPLDSNLANIVWEWHFWDHLIQDMNPDLPSYGSIADNPQLLNINSTPFSFLDGDQLPGADAGDWMHCNSITYNAILDQIVLSSRHRSELYVIDHSTTTEEASLHSGGNFGIGGDFLYRWGNPQNYGRGDANDQILKGQHSVVWIPEDFPGYGNFILFNNFHTINNSAVLEIVPPVNQDGSYFIDSINAYDPVNYNWVYELGHMAAVRGGVWRLPNGNTIITTFNELFEINDNSDIEWVYNGSLSPSRVIKYELDYFNLNNDLLYDMNDDGVVNNSDFVMLLSFVIGGNNFLNAADINFDLVVDIFDLVFLSDYMQDI